MLHSCFLYEAAPSITTISPPASFSHGESSIRSFVEAQNSLASFLSPRESGSRQVSSCACHSAQLTTYITSIQAHLLANFNVSSFPQNCDNSSSGRKTSAVLQTHTVFQSRCSPKSLDTPVKQTYITAIRCLQAILEACKEDIS